MKTKKRWTWSVIAAAALAGMAAWAQEPATVVAAPGAALPIVKAGGWKVEVTPYAWLLGIDGEIEIGDKHVDVDQSFNDLIEHVDFAGSVLTVVQKDRLVVFGQLDYFELSEEGDVPGETAHKGEITLDNMFAVVSAGWQFDGFVEGSTIDVMGGARFASMDAKVEVYDVGSRHKDSELWDPVVVIRPSFPLFPSKIDGLRLNPTFSVGGGGDSDLVYELQPELQYNFTDAVAGRLGYRRVHYEFEGGRDSDWDMDFSGLVVGVGVTF